MILEKRKHVVEYKEVNLDFLCMEKILCFKSLSAFLRECQRHNTVAKLGEEAPHVVDAVPSKDDK